MSESETAVEVAAAPAPEAQPAASAVDPTVTLRQQLSAADAARVKAQKDAETARAEAASYAARLAEIEGANKSELEKALDKAKAADERATKAEAEAREVILKTKYPNATADLEGEPFPSDEALARLEAKLVKANAPAPEAPEPRIDANNPRKQTAPATPADPRKALEEAWIAEAARIRGF